MSSLASIVPGSHAIAEFIEVVKNAIEDREEADQNENGQERGLDRP